MMRFRLSIYHTLVLTLMTSACAGRQELHWAKPTHSISVDSKVYQEMGACRALYKVCGRNCCTTYECQQANEDLYERCEYGHEIGGPGALLSLYPHPFTIERPEQIPSVRALRIDIIATLKALADKVKLNFVIDSSNHAMVNGSLYDVQWNDAFQSLAKSGGLASTPFCHALAIGRTGVIREDSFSPGIEAEGNRIVLKNCEDHYTGRKFSFSYDDTPVEDALAQISVLSNLNFLVPETVKGFVSGRLRNIPWDEALDVVLAVYGLDKVQSGNVIRIDKAENLRAEREAMKMAICSCCDLQDIKGITKNRSGQKPAK